MNDCSETTLPPEELVRRLAIVILLATLATPAAQAFAQDGGTAANQGAAPVDVFKVTGLIDPVLADGIDVLILLRGGTAGDGILDETRQGRLRRTRKR